MKLKFLIPLNVRRVIQKYRIKNKYKNVVIKKNVDCDNRTYFEGYNLLNDNTSISECFIGRGTYISGGTKLTKAKIGRFCSIGQNVKNSFGIHPSSGFVSTHPAFYSTKKQAGFSFVKEDLFEEHKYIDNDKKYLIEIGNDVWIGNNVMIFDNVKIGDGAIIAAGAVVTKNVEPYEIVGGVPTKLIRRRFDEETIEKLLKIKWWDWDFDTILKNASLFCDINLFLYIFKK